MNNGVRLKHSWNGDGRQTEGTKPRRRSRQQGREGAA